MEIFKDFMPVIVGIGGYYILNERRLTRIETKVDMILKYWLDQKKAGD